MRYGDNGIATFVLQLAGTSSGRAAPRLGTVGFGVGRSGTSLYRKSRDVEGRETCLA